MKNLTPRSLRFIPAALGLGFCLLAYHAGAFTGSTWDPQGTAGGQPTSGSWESADWSTSTSEAAQATPVKFVEGEAACFAVGASGGSASTFTVTMSANHTVAGLFNGPLNPSSCFVTITGSGTMILPNSAQGFATDGSTAGQTIINVVIGGIGPLQPEDGSPLYLNGANTYTGGTIFDQTGIVYFNSSSSFGASSGTLTMMASGGALVNNTTSLITFANPWTAASVNLNIVPGSGGTTFTGNWTLSATTPIIGAGNVAGNVLTLSGVISGTGGFIKYNSGTLVLSGVNTFTGGIQIAGPLTIGAPGQLASGNYSGTISNGGTFTYASTASQTLSGVISAAGTLSQSAGTLTLSGANTYTGVTTISGGILNANHSESVGTSGAFGESADSNPGNIVMSGGTLQYSSNNSHDFSGRFSTAASQHYNIDVNGRPITYATALTSSGGELTLSDTAGGGTLTLSAANTYSGGTTINAGTLSVNTIADSGTSALSTSGTLTFGGGTLSYSGSSAASTSRTVSATAGTTSTINLPSGGLTLSGGVGSGNNFTINKTGSGTLTLSGATDNAWLGMNVNGGTLVLAKNPSASGVHALGGTGTATVASGATLQLGGSGGYEIYSGVSVTVSSGGVFDLNSQSDSFTSLSLAGPGISSGGALVNSTTSATSTLTLSSGLTLAANSSIGGNGSITISSAISGSGMSLTYSGAGTLTLGAANSYSGGTTISSGTLDGSVSGSIPGNVTVSATSGTALKLDNTSAMASSAALTLPASPTAGLVNLNLSGGTQTINAMYWGATSMATGTWGSTTSSAAHQNAAFTGNGLLQINSGGASQTITFPNPGTQTYGVAPITLTATALGGTVTYTVTSGPATVAGSTLTITGAGSVTVQANQAGNNTYDAAPAVNDTFTVDPLPVTLAGNPNKIYDGTTGVAGVDLKVTNPVGADLVFVGGTGGLAGSGFGLQTINSFTSLSLNGPQAANYTLTGASGSVVITAGDTSCNDTLANNNNGGTGFAAWTGVSAPSPGGVYDTGTSPAGDLCATAWGIYTGTGTATTSVQRPLANSDTLQVGQSLRVDMQNGGINSPGSEGLSLYNSANNAVFELFFSGGATYWTINASSVSPASAIPYAGTSGGCRAIFTLTGSGTTYSLTVQVPIGGTNYGPYTGSLLSPTGGQSITQLRFYTYDIGNTYNLQFNDLAVGCPTPTVTTQPSPTTVCAGSTASFTAASTTASSPTFQWQVNTGSGWNNVSTGSGGTTGTYMTPATTTGMNDYQYRCVVTDACGVAANSTAATLTVNPLPTASVNSAAVCAGASATLTATTSASSPSYLWNDPSSATTASITVSPASTTTYTVTVTDGTTSCANSGSGTVTVNPLPTASVNSATICAGASATLNATSSASSPGYLWNDPSSATTASITVSPASTTTYTVTVTDGTTGCANSGSGTVTVNSTPATPGTITQANPSGSSVCANASGVTYSISAVSGATTYTWTVPTGATITAGAGTTSITVAWGTATSGSVQVTAGNTCGASSASSLGVTVDPGPTGPTVSIAPSSSICVGSPATFSVSTASGSPSGYAWRKRDPALGWGAGNNWVFTYNSGGCDSYNGVFIGSATGSGQSPGINHSGQAFGLYANTYNSAEAKRSFGSLSIGQNISFDVQLPVTLTGSDGSGHYSQALFALRNSANEANPRLEMWVLAGSADVTLSDNAGDTTTTLPYNHNGYHCVFTLTGNNTYNLTVTLSDSSSGPYYFSGTLKGTANDPVNEVRAWLKNYDSAGGSAEDFYFNNIVAGAYEDNASNYTAGGCASTTWTTTPNLGFGPVSSSASYVISSPATTDSGSYDVLVWDSCGQAFASPVTLTVNPLPTASVNSVAICAGTSATLTATTSASSPGYLWSPGGATTASITVSPASTTTYTVTVTDGTTGCANSGSGTVTVNPLPTASVNSATICAGASATLTATTSASSPSYLWNDPSSATTASITVSPASTTTYTVTVTDGTTGCANSGSGTVTVNPLPTASVNSATVCAGASATLTATTSASSPSYLWNDPSSATTASITVSPASTTTYTVTVTDGTTGCANSGSGTVTVNPLPTVSVNSATTTNCAGGSATLTVTTSASSPSYLWNDPSSATTASITVSPASTTTYTVTVTDGTTGCANSGSGTVTVMVCTTNNLTASPNPALPSQDMTFTATLTAAPGAGTPTGTVLFKTNGVPAGDPIELDGSGVATLTLAAGSLPHGANTVTNEYAGDGDFLGSTNYVMQIVNTPPVASNTTTSVTENTSLVLSVGKLLSLAYDADGDSLSITSAGSTSTNGPADNVVLDNVAGTITYTPATDFVGTDMFSFVVSDTYGGSSTGTVLVTLTSASVPSPNIVVPPAYSNGTFTVTFAGIPGYTYTIQYSPNVTGGPWTTLTTLTADEDDGLFQVIDTESSPPPQRYYRTVGGTPPSP